MNTQSKGPITIIGAGLGGCFLALLLAKRGYTVDIYEKFNQNEIIASYTASRTYNLTFYDYGVAALKEAGVWDMLEPELVKLAGSYTQISHNPARFNKESPYYAVQRDTLLKTLIDEAKRHSQVSFHFGTALVAVNRQEKTIVIQDNGSKVYKTVSCEVIFGADGVNSQVRTALQSGQQSSHIQEYADWEYRQIHLHKDIGKRLGLKKDLMYAWTRKDCVILGHPNIDESFSALLILPKDNKKGFSTLTSESIIKDFFVHNFPDFLPALTDVTKDLLNNPTSYFVTIYTEPWYYKDFMVILGDAAHGFNPFYGQGVSAAFADCITLTQLIDKNGPDWGTIFPLYQKARKKHTDALAYLSKESIAQYHRAKKADYISIYNRLDETLYQFFPKIFHPPPYVHLATDPILVGDYFEKHQRQRKKAKFIGVPIAVSIVTGIVALQEMLSNHFTKKK